jgi:hypothetical protein
MAHFGKTTPDADIASTRPAPLDTKPDTVVFQDRIELPHYQRKQPEEHAEPSQVEPGRARAIEAGQQQQDQRQDLHEQRRRQNHKSPFARFPPGARLSHSRFPNS